MDNDAAGKFSGADENHYRFSYIPRQSGKYDLANVDYGRRKLFHIIWFKNYFDNVPTAIIDAAKIDGATNLKIFYKIVLPMAQPVILTQALTGFIGAWQDYFWPMLLLKDKNIQTIMVRVLALQGSLSMDKRMIMLVLVMVPPMIFFMVFQKYLMGDANAGGVKG